MVEMTKHAEVNQYQPPLVFIEIQYVISNAQRQELALHALASPQIVEAAHGDAVGDRTAVLAVEINAVATSHLARGIIMQARCVVVALSAATVVKRKTLVAATPRDINAVQLPVETFLEGFAAVERFKRRHRIGGLNAASRRVFEFHQAEKHGICFSMRSENVDSGLQGVA